jgi:hypothetical protein
MVLQDYIFITKGNWTVFFLLLSLKSQQSKGKRVKICSFTKSICHHSPKFSSSNVLQLINWDLIPEFSTLNSRSPVRNKSSTPKMKNLMKWFGETGEKGIQTSPNRDTCLYLSELCVDIMCKVGGKMILFLESCAWNPSSCSIL